MCVVIFFGPDMVDVNMPQSHLLGLKLSTGICAIGDHVLKSFGFVEVCNIALEVSQKVTIEVLLIALTVVKCFIFTHGHLNAKVTNLVKLMQKLR